MQFPCLFMNHITAQPLCLFPIRVLFPEIAHKPYRSLPMFLLHHKNTVPFPSTAARDSPFIPWQTSPQTRACYPVQLSHTSEAWNRPFLPLSCQRPVEEGSQQQCSFMWTSVARVFPSGDINIPPRVKGCSGRRALAAVHCSSGWTSWKVEGNSLTYHPILHLLLQYCRGVNKS